MGRFKIEIKTGNDAMQTPADVAGVVAECLALLHWSPDFAPSVQLADTNGNTVGSMSYQADDEADDEEK